MIIFLNEVMEITKTAKTLNLAKKRILPNLAKKRILPKKQQTLKDVRAHCYCASLVRTLFIVTRVPRHFQARALIRKLNKT